MFLKYTVYIFILHFSIPSTIANDLLKSCKRSTDNGIIDGKCRGYQSHFSSKRYIFYDVNPSEGFNLRRDVYIRAATFIRQLIEIEKHYEWNLVLPPWGNLYHWKSTDIESQIQIPWGMFFDIESLKKYIPVLEMYEFIEEYPKENGNVVLDCVYFLRNDEEMFKTGNFSNKNIKTDCPKNLLFPYKKRSSDQFTGSFWNYINITARKVECVIFHGTTFDLKINLQPNLYRTIMFDRMEVPLHFAYGSADYWKARRSMRYNSKLYKIANEFRLSHLNSNDKDDNTQRPEDWRDERKQRNAFGGPYLAVHFRRQDFVTAHISSSPTVQNATSQIKMSLKLLHLNVVFIATDAEEKEYTQLKNNLMDYSIFRFVPTENVKQQLKDGGVSIIDQIICSHARYFIGTHESTFTFRIQEDREILGFPANTTFNMLHDIEKKRSADGKWKIVWN